jgi:3-dehydroquinate dehydratase-2
LTPEDARGLIVGALSVLRSHDRIDDDAGMARAPKILVVNGPNLNMLGVREPAVYGRDRLTDIEKLCRKAARQLGLAIDFRQSNHEGEIVGWLQEARGSCAGIVINAGAYTHTSVALLDALNAAELPVVEVHLSNIYKRESFRHRSYISPAAIGVIAGLGTQAYLLALQALARHLAR